MRYIFYVLWMCLAALSVFAAEIAQLEAARKAEDLLSVDAGVQHSEENARSVRQFGGGFGGPGGFGQGGFGQGGGFGGQGGFGQGGFGQGGGFGGPGGFGQGGFGQGGGGGFGGPGFGGGF
ncbi:glycine-rich cell wall structural protein [Bactrocera tryoni]|uniref:glycine-rich cell wall structural protein n=1 Tax=Bactrocera tryoni TaxID=59916 RepID=UPI001A977F92|nr:glycine-rich cell wall structural protein [Bactrocera tryoni]